MDRIRILVLLIVICLTPALAFEKEFRGPIFELYSCDQLKAMKKSHICMTECAMKKRGTIDDKGVIDVKKVKELFNKLIAAEWMKVLTIVGIEKCISSKGGPFLASDSGESRCNPAAINFKHCVWRELVKTCPEDHQEKSNLCDRIRTAFKEEKQRIIYKIKRRN